MIDENELQRAVDAGIIDSSARDRLVTFTRARAPSASETFGLARAPKSDVTHAPLYAGGLILIGVLGVFAATAFNDGWIYMELGAVVASAVALRFFRFPFILLIAAVALWLLSMDIAGWFGRDAIGDWELRRQVSLAFGLAMIAIAWTLDLSRSRDFGFWLHFLGAIAVWLALTASEGATALGGGLYCVINIGFIALGLFLDRRIYAVLGTLGVASYLGYLASDVFRDVLAFSFALSAIGLAIIFLGIFFQRRRRQIDAAIERRMPATLKALRPRRAGELSSARI